MCWQMVVHTYTSVGFSVECHFRFRFTVGWFLPVSKPRCPGIFWFAGHAPFAGKPRWSYAAIIANMWGFDSGLVRATGWVGDADLQTD